MIVVGLHRLFQKAQRFYVLAAEIDFGLVVRHQLIARARSADRVEIAFKPFLFQHVAPDVGIGNKIAVLVVEQTLGDGEYRGFLLDGRQNLFAEPLHAEARHAADYEVGAVESALKLLDLVELHASRKILDELRVTIGCLARVDDFAVEVSAHKAHLMSVFSRRERQRRTHHARDYDCYDAHFSLTP